MNDISEELAQAKETISALQARIEKADASTLFAGKFTPYQEGDTTCYCASNDFEIESSLCVNLFLSPPITSERELALLAIIEQMREELRYINEVSCGDCELVDVQDDTEAMAYINKHIFEFLDKEIKKIDQ